MENGGHFEKFAGGVPPGEVFRSHVDSLVALSEESVDGTRSRTQPELCVIGLHAYFEAFCKDQFAALINIHTHLVHNLKQRNHDVTLDCTTLLSGPVDPRFRVGFLLAEKFDFGTAQKINSLYQALLRVTPFSKDEERRYAEMVADRNLLVHHGGTYTSQYLESRTISDVPDKFRPHMDGLDISPARVKANGLFLAGVARKTVRASHAALSKLLKVEGHAVSRETENALFMMLWWGDEGA